MRVSDNEQDINKLRPHRALTTSYFCPVNITKFLRTAFL